MTTGNGYLTLEAALAYRRGGLSVIPVRGDGSKAPAIAWTEFQRRLPDEDEITRWFGNEQWGVGVVGGKVSGHLEIIDFDADAESVYPAWAELVEAEAPGLVARLSIRRTPKPGFHVGYRCPDVAIPGNMKLAVADGATLIETRGEGGQVLAPGCPPNCHPSGRLYEHHSGPVLSQVPTITASERELLLRCARSFDRSAGLQQQSPRANGTSDRPGDEYSRRGPDWSEILEPAGWAEVHRRGSIRYWRRPGKDGPGWSATTGACSTKDGVELLAVFSSNAHPFEGAAAGRQCSCYSKFAAYALLRHRGDYAAAAKDLSGQGYGAPRNGKPAQAQQDDHGDAWEGAGIEAPARRLIWRRLADVKTRAIEWIWPGRIVRRAVNLLDGDPGLGKSTVVCDLVARITRGWRMPPLSGPGGLSPSAVLMLVGEDDAATTLRPRLESHGADLSMVHVLDGVRVGTSDTGIDLPRDLDVIEQLALDIGAVMLTIDVLDDYIDDQTDTHRSASTRHRIMRPLRQLADRTGMAILAIRHLSKMVSVESAMHRGVGSIAMIAAARSAMIIGRHPDEPRQRVLASTKCNLAEAPPALAYSIETTEQGQPVIAWHGEAGIRADDLVARSKVRQADETMARKIKGDAAAVLVYLDEHDQDRQGVGLRALRTLGWGPDRVDRACQVLIDGGSCEWCDLETRRGKAGGQPAQGIRRVSGL